MTLAEHIYRMLIWLYPTKHRLAYEQLMVQHARDMNHAARQRGRWHVAILCLRLSIDGIVNAFIEHMGAIMMAKNRFKPSPWLSVILASMPGLLLALSRRHVALPDPLLLFLGYFYLGLLVLVLPIILWRKRQFPAWALLPAGALMWFLTYLVGTQLSQQVNALHILSMKWIEVTGIALLDIILAAVIFVTLLRGLRIPRSIWLVFGVIVFGNILLAILYSDTRYGGAHFFLGLLQYFTTSGIGPVEGLMLVAVGLLAARQHGALALLVVVGGYSYMCADLDYLFGHPLREWAGISSYLVAVTVLFLVVVPVALLRAKTRLGRASAVFIPLVAFHVARLSIPLLVIQQPLIKIQPGEVVLSINVVLSFILAWVLYSYFGEASRNSQLSGSYEVSPLPS